MKHNPADGPVIASRRGFFWVGTERTASPFGAVVKGPMFVQWEAPESPRHHVPVLLIHGGGGQGTDWLGTPDGRPGWAPCLVQEGYVVYVVDRPGHGRSAYHPDVLGPMAPPMSYEAADWLFRSPGGPLTARHTQWPGERGDGDPVMGQFVASAGPMIADIAAAHALEQARGAELLDLIGPAIVITHSAGGPMGWLLADTSPHAVAALVAIEPLGPPFLQDTGSGLKLPWGLTAAPVTFDPPVASAAELPLVQAGQPLRLPNIARVPVAVVSGEASALAGPAAATHAFLRQADCPADLIRLAEHGVRGNGHGMIFERNNRAVLDVILSWVAGIGY